MIQGKGELRKQYTRYVGHITMGGRTIMLNAVIDEDGEGKFLRIEAQLHNVDTPEDMVRVLRGPDGPADNMFDSVMRA